MKTLVAMGIAFIVIALAVTFLGLSLGTYHCLIALCPDLPDELAQIIGTLTAAFIMIFVVVRAMQE